jgi:hypothetical protein
MGGRPAADGAEEALRRVSERSASVADGLHAVLGLSLSEPFVDELID